MKVTSNIVVGDALRCKKCWHTTTLTYLEMKRIVSSVFHNVKGLSLDHNDLFLDYSALKRFKCQKCGAKDVELVKRGQSDHAEPSVVKTKKLLCQQCGGDGGAGGRCPRCGGNGFEP